jgi:hypothetical protein
MLAVDDFIQDLLADEGWQEDLDGDTVEAAIKRLEDLLPAGSEIAEDRAARLQEALRQLGAIARQPGNQITALTALLAVAEATP